MLQICRVVLLLLATLGSSHATVTWLTNSERLFLGDDNGGVTLPASSGRFTEQSRPQGSDTFGPRGTDPSNRNSQRVAGFQRAALLAEGQWGLGGEVTYNRSLFSLFTVEATGSGTIGMQWDSIPRVGAQNRPTFGLDVGRSGFDLFVESGVITSMKITAEYFTRNSNGSFSRVDVLPIAPGQQNRGAIARALFRNANNATDSNGNAVGSNIDVVIETDGNLLDPQINVNGGIQRSDITVDTVNNRVSGTLRNITSSLESFDLQTIQNRSQFSGFNTVSVTLTPNGESQFRQGSIYRVTLDAIEATTIPEPSSTFVLIGLLAGFFVGHRRR